MINSEQAIEIFKKYGIKTNIINNMLIISHYNQPKEGTFKELGIDEDELISNVTACEGKFETKNSSLTTFPLTACKELRLDKDTKIAELPNLKSVGIFLANEHLKKAPKLKLIASGSFENSKIRSLPKLKKAGVLTIQNSALESLPLLECVGKICIIDCPVSDLKKLEIAQDIFICSTDEKNKVPISSLNSLEEAENIFMANTDLKALPKLKKAEKIALYNCEIKNLKPLKNTQVEIREHISDSELEERFDNFTDWYNSDILDKSMSLIGSVASAL